eukprot:TRINITY_DN56669_c0_g1_i1.p1 TRINITY_DN56669_c0_g1~~TRINITY_DN56669_c0_g1_i1.p1  ORF type:complete len:334 (+),score=16.12 TRINITY_DN56669_c0_g1_i1:83-1084(+)
MPAPFSWLVADDAFPGSHEALWCARVVKAIIWSFIGFVALMAFITFYFYGKSAQPLWVSRQSIMEMPDIVICSWVFGMAAELKVNKHHISFREGLAYAASIHHKEERAPHVQLFSGVNVPPTRRFKDQVVDEGCIGVKPPPGEKGLNYTYEPLKPQRLELVLDARLNISYNESASIKIGLADHEHIGVPEYVLARLGHVNWVSFTESALYMMYFWPWDFEMYSRYEASNEIIPLSDDYCALHQMRNGCTVISIEPDSFLVQSFLRFKYQKSVSGMVVFACGMLILLTVSNSFNFCFPVADRYRKVQMGITFITCGRVKGDSIREDHEDQPLLS